MAISIHAPMRGATRPFLWRRWSGLYFNPRPPCGGRPLAGKILALRSGFQSTPPMRGATLCSKESADRPGISIHAPHAGGDDKPNRLLDKLKEFQSTPPMRGATI